jgi:hypothetical protein
MIDLIQFQIDNQNFNKLALETIKKEAEKRNVSDEPPSLKRLNSDNSTNEENVKTKKTKTTKDKKTEDKLAEKSAEKPEDKTNNASGKKPRLRIIEDINSKRLAINPKAVLVDDFMLSLEKIE